MAHLAAAMPQQTSDSIRWQAAPKLSRDRDQASRFPDWDGRHFLVWVVSRLLLKHAGGGDSGIEAVYYRVRARTRQHFREAVLSVASPDRNILRPLSPRKFLMR